MEQKIYSQEAHQIEIRNLDKEALYVLEKLTSAGHTAYLVGGGVRDLLLKKTPKDYDISTSAEPEQVRRLFRNCILIGKRFRLAHIRFGKKIIEVSTFRTGDTENDALIVRDNEWGSPEEDVLRRDFTINGLFYDATNQTVIDYVGGFPDLEKQTLRAIGQPFIRFKQDPVRMLRLLKFKARFGFIVDPNAETALIESKHEILKSSSARILEELLRMLELGSATLFFRLMADYGILQLILPAVASALEKEEEGKEVYRFLQELDTLSAEYPEIDRSISLCCLIFPTFLKRIETLFQGKDRHPHLGEIQEEAYAFFDESFEPFFKIPKRLKISVVSILTTQFRLVPFDKKRPKSFRIPHDPNFRFALAFLGIRCQIDPSLQKITKEWLDAASELEEEPVTHRPPRRRRRRPS